MVNITTLLPELRALVTELTEDLLARSIADTKIDAGLRDAFKQIEKGGRTAQAFEIWRDDYLDQVAVAWVLACVFVRFMEDNHLIDECWLAGAGDRRKLAEGAHELFFRKHPHETDREYFEHVFREVGKIPAAKELFAEGKTPLWAVGPSGDAAMKMLAFWREIDPEEGHLLRSFEVEKGDTRFLGDLYQDLSEKARKKYALLQTPVFVEEFILDRTLTPALNEFGLEKVRLIDPTCGSGHFLLGAFARLFRLWMKKESNEIVAAQKALDGVWGVDINPFAVAIARFRLIVAAVQACDIKRLKKAPGWAIHLAAGDSLLFGSKPGWKGERTPISQQATLFEVDPIYAFEDRQAVNHILGQGYHVVVGNPPYIIVRDRSLNAAIRGLYSTCHQKYSLGVPFTQRLWELAIQQGESNGGCGYIGQITANSFMKREFGKKLIEQFFPKIDLTHVIDTSGAYIPGHGTPTVILLGRARKPVGETVRAALGIKGEPTPPEDASQGKVWRSVVQQIDTAGSQDEFTSTADVPRTTFNIHPWSIGGGGASNLKEDIEENAGHDLAESAESIGIVCFTLADDVYIIPQRIASLRGIAGSSLRRMVVGTALRDWIELTCDSILFPYKDSSTPLPESPESPLFRHLWFFRTILANGKMFGGKTKIQCGLRWYEYGRLTSAKLASPYSIVFANIATHNHFQLNRGGSLFDCHAPIIKLPVDNSEESHLALVGLLNSSVGCFWMKQACHNKGNEGYQSGIKSEAWEKFYEFNGTALLRFPVPSLQPLTLSCELDKLGQVYGALLPEALVGQATPTAEILNEARTKASANEFRRIALQEELDWHCYQLYGLLSDDLCYPGDDLPELALGKRAFEIVMARQAEQDELQTTWFERHGSTPITEIPTQWPAAYRKLVERRIKLIETNKEIRLIEKPEYKRRWNTEPWAEQEQRALKNWLLDRLEDKRYWPNVEQQSTARLADRASTDAEFMQVAALYRGRPDFDVAALVAELVESESVPFLPILRYKATGLRKREVWEQTWTLQRQQDELARQRAAIEESLRQIRSRIEKAFFAADQKALDEMDAELKKRCIQARKSHAPTVAFEDNWSGSRMALELESGGITTAQGAAVLIGLVETKKEIAHRRHVLTTKVVAKCGEDAEFKAKDLERVSIPDDPEIPVPPKYATADFVKTDYWRLRGKLDVPKERWISYPHCSTENDPSLVVGWAGWNHLQQADSLIAYYNARKNEGWTANRLTPLLAGLDQLLPWIHQWHPEIDKEYGETAGKSFQTMLEHDAHELGLTLEEIRQWTPPATTTRRRARK